MFLEKLVHCVYKLYIVIKDFSLYLVIFSALICVKGYEVKKITFSWYFRFLSKVYLLSKLEFSSKLHRHLPEVGFPVISPHMQL